MRPAPAAEARSADTSPIPTCRVRLARIELEKLHHSDENRPGLFDLVSERVC
jgi:hypothetical protein